ncbi:ATP-binding protein [Streptomyces sp. NEAU-174]|uniref:ATP-binding protein n=1 Tax=Streptomyces sp. NEAU-174 TaxID=3458254 RepID=UPI0040442DB1
MEIPRVKRVASGGAQDGRPGMVRFPERAARFPQRDTLIDLVEPRVHRIRAEAEPSTFGAVRRDISHQMQLWGLAPMAYGVCLVVTELLSNVHRHAGGGESDLLLRHSRGELWVMVGDRSHELPAIENLDVTKTSGRGLMVVDEYADQWVAVPTSVGKVVICRFTIQENR